jgi:hypothetical protein
MFTILPQAYCISHRRAAQATEPDFRYNLKLIAGIGTKINGDNAASANGAQLSTVLSSWQVKLKR